MPTEQNNPFKGKEFVSDQVKKEGAKIANAANAAKDKFTQAAKDTAKGAAEKIASSMKKPDPSGKSQAV